ncbi:hypothetical protein Pfo_004177, partial [Paulownia fortunei]
SPQLYASIYGGADSAAENPSSAGTPRPPLRFILNFWLMLQISHPYCHSTEPYMQGQRTRRCLGCELIKSLKQKHLGMVTIIVPQQPQHGQYIALKLQEEGVLVALWPRGDKLTTGTNLLFCNMGKERVAEEEKSMDGRKNRGKLPLLYNEVTLISIVRGSNVN